MNQLDHNPFFKDEALFHTIRQRGHDGEKAILSLYTSYRKPVRKAISDLFKLYPSCHVEEDDILHDAFLVLVHKIQHENLSAGPLLSLWRGIARKLILNQVRRNKNLTFVEDVEDDYATPEISPESLFIITEENKALENFIDKSGGRCKEILLLWLSQYNMDEIAVQMNLRGASMARKMKYHCFNKLRQLLIEGHVIQY